MSCILSVGIEWLVFLPSENSCADSVRSVGENHQEEQESEIWFSSTRFHRETLWGSSLWKTSDTSKVACRRKEGEKGGGDQMRWNMWKMLDVQKMWC